MRACLDDRSFALCATHGWLAAVCLSSGVACELEALLASLDEREADATLDS